MQREGRIIPVVGDFAGDRAMPGIAALLRERKLYVSTFYVSDVEQYLLDPDVWRNGSATSRPSERRDSVFVRAYLDQGKRHRTAEGPPHRDRAPAADRFRRAPAEGARSFFALRARHHRDGDVTGTVARNR
jgi:hypothetical protein